MRRLFARLGIRARLAMLALLMLGSAGFFFAQTLEGALQVVLEDRAERELVRHAQAFAAALALAPERSAQAVAQTLSSATDVNVSLFDAKGRTLADSRLRAADLALNTARSLAPERSLAPDKGDKTSAPEVMAALLGERGRARRVHGKDTDKGKALTFWVALPQEDGGVVRASMLLAEVVPIVSPWRRLLWLAGGLALLLALLIGVLASYLNTLTLRRMVVRARSLGAEAPDDDVAGDELDYLMGSYESMATELRRALRSLAKARDRFEVIVEGMDQAVFRLSSKGQIKLANRAAVEWLGLDDAPLGQAMVEVLPEVRPLLENELGSDELELPGGRVVMAQHSVMRLSRGSVVVLYDVSRVRRLERLRRDFVANVSHELRTPISVIRTNTEALLSEGPMDETQRRQFLEALGRSSLRLSRLFADLLDLARIEAGGFAPTLTSVRVADVIGVTADAVMERVEKNGHEVSLELEEGLEVEADAGALEQVLINLLDNAAKYTPEKGKLTIKARRVGARARIEIGDNGPGIGEEHRARLFERFYRVDPGRSREMGGTGLGLSIVKHLVIAMGGDVGMEPNSPQGAIFYVELASSPATPAGNAT